MGWRMNERRAIGAEAPPTVMPEFASPLVPAQTARQQHSAIYQGVIRHRRHAPHAHAFSYRLFMLYLDLDEVDTVFEDRWLWSVGHRNVAEFRRSDYLGDPDVPLADAVRARIADATGRLPEGPAADVDMAELARYAARAMAAERVPLKVEVADGLPMVRGHHDALARALSNVLLNAVEACRDGGEVAVRVAKARLDGRDAVEVAVRDTGCGIPEAQLSRIWEPYVTSKLGGTGLGLAIARQTVLAHGGAVDAASAEGEGTEVRFVIPVDGGG